MARFLRILAHPLALLALGLLAFNDFWLKNHFPSLLSGKLSDVCALVLLPLLLAGLLSLGLERRRAGWLSLGLVAAAFILFKAGPQTSAWLRSLFALGGFPLRGIPDPSDLLALPALALPAWLWLRPPAPALPAPRWRILLLPLAGLLLLADAAMPDRGVSCLAVQDGVLRAQAGLFDVYTSADGGFTWTAVDRVWEGECGIPGDAQAALFSLPQGGVAYRITRGVSVERSADNGQTWQTLDFRSQASEAEQTYILKTRSGNISFEDPPLDALLDERSGNLLLAMGQQGLVVVRPDGSWQPAAVGPYRRELAETAGAAGYFTLLAGEVYLALLVGLAWLATAGLRRRRGVWRVVTVLTWVALLLTAVALLPEIADDSYTGLAPILGLIGSAVLTIALLVGGVLTLRMRILPKAPVALLVAVVVLLPYLLWGLAILPLYWMALVLAVGLAAAAVILVK